MENVKRIINKFYSRKHIMVSIRLDAPTYIVVEDIKKSFNLNNSELFRLAVWILAILLDPNATLRQILTDEAINKLCNDGDISFIDSLSSLGNVLENRVKEYYKFYKEL